MSKPWANRLVEPWSPATAGLRYQCQVATGTRGQSCYTSRFVHGPQCFHLSQQGQASAPRYGFQKPAHYSAKYLAEGIPSQTAVHVWVTATDHK